MTDAANTWRSGRCAAWLLTAAALIAAALVLLAPAGARAATVRVDTVVEENETPPESDTLVLDADGRRFRGAVRRSGDSFTFTSSRDSIRAGVGCRRLTARRARCRVENPLVSITISLSNRGDQFKMGGDRIDDSEVIVRGGGGNDAIVGPHFRRASTGALLVGGGGRDRIVGGNGRDTLSGGGGRDRLEGRGGRDALEDRGPARRSSRDHFDGGGGRDTISYRGRARGSRVDLARGRGGRGSEGDRLRRLEIVLGGNGNDTLIGNRGANELVGGRGNDTVRGGRGDDALGFTVLEGDIYADLDAGSDRYSGGPGRDRFVTLEDSGSSRDQVACGANEDVILRSNGEDSMGGDCEIIRIADVYDAVPGSISVNPFVEGTQAVFHLTCDVPEGARCSGELAIDGLAAPRASSFDVGPGTSDVVVNLTAEDAERIADSERGVVVEIHARFDEGPAAQWTATLR